MGTLFVVSTPIGNLDDLTIRGRETLKEADRVLAEDTRRARVLLGHIGAPGKPYSLHAHNEARRIPQVCDWLAVTPV